MRRLLGLSSSLLALAACASAQTPAPARERASVVWDYRVRQSGGDLEVEARFDGGARRLVLHADALPFVEALTVDGAPAARSGTTFRGGACEAGPCVVRYRFRLADAAPGLAGTLGTQPFADGVVISPTLFLIRPSVVPDGAQYELRVETEPGTRFEGGRERTADGAWTGPARTLVSACYSIFGAFEQRTISVGGAELVLAIAPGGIAAGNDAIEHWAHESARAISEYFLRFPVPRALVVVLPTRGDDVYYGSTRGWGGASIRINVGREADESALMRDWTMAHEMAHFAMPNVGRDIAWVEEGFATYVESVARVRAGLMSEQEYFREMIENLPRGLAGHELHSATSPWLLAYWKGALFFFIADLEIRERTRGERSLADALRAVVAAGGDIRASWDVEEMWRVGDRGAGAAVLGALYREAVRRGLSRDLDAIWRRLGVTSAGGQMVLRDDAPGADMRRAITRGTGGN